MKAARSAYLDAKEEIAKEVKRLEKLAEEATKAANNAGVALADLKKRAKEKEEELKAINKELKSASSEAAKTAKKEGSEATKAAKKEASEAEKAAKKEASEAEKAAKKQASEAEKAAKKEAAKLAKEAEIAAKLAAEEAERERQEKVEMCEKLACAIHRFRHKVVKDLSDEADDIVNDLEKYGGCEQEGMPEEDQIVVTKEDALWFKELVKFVKKTERRLQQLIDNNKDSRGNRLDWRTSQHNHMIEDVCPEDEEEEQEGGRTGPLGKMYGTDSELDTPLRDEYGNEEDLGIDDDDDDEEDGGNEKIEMVREKVNSGEFQKDVFKHYAGVLAVDNQGDMKVALQAPEEQAPAGATAPPPPPPGSEAQGQQSAPKGKKRITPIPLNPPSGGP